MGGSGGGDGSFLGGSSAAFGAVSTSRPSKRTRSTPAIGKADVAAAATALPFSANGPGPVIRLGASLAIRTAADIMATSKYKYFMATSCETLAT